MFYKLSLLIILISTLSNQNSVDPQKLFARHNADRIMGEAMHVTINIPKNTKLSTSYLCGYEATAKPKTGRPGAIYFLFEHYRDKAEAVKKYAVIHEANKPNGIEDLSGLGDEAYYQTDGQNFYFIMVRKGRYVFNIKVNKITRTTSLDEFKKTARSITAALDNN